MSDGRKSNGGTREGAGRKFGPAKKMSRRKANELCDKSETPMDVMHANMMFWHREANRHTQRIAELLSQALEIDDVEQRTECIKQVEGVFHLLSKNRDRAQSAAVDLAPYCHPKLASVQLTGKEGAPLIPAKLIVEFE